MAVATDALLDEVRRFVDDEALPAVAQYDRGQLGRVHVRPTAEADDRVRPKGLRGFDAIEDAVVNQHIYVFAVSGGSRHVRAKIVIPYLALACDKNGQDRSTFDAENAVVDLLWRNGEHLY